MKILNLLIHEEVIKEHTPKNKGKGQFNFRYLI